MPAVENNSYIKIKRRIGSDVVTLYNELFNGYVYSMSLDVGYNGNPTSLTLNLALNKTLSQVKLNNEVITNRKQDIKRVKALVASRKETLTAFVGNVGNVGNLGTKTYSDISRIADKDFNIDPKYLGVTCSYDIGIYNSQGQASYEFKNFKIVSFSINKKNNQKILTLVLKDNSFVLDKIYVGLLGQEIALDSRSESEALVNGITISCPPVGTNCPGGKVTLNLNQTLHFSNENFKKNFLANFKVDQNKNFQDINFSTGNSANNSNKNNYVLITHKDTNKSIFKGFGAVIILGEEDYKDTVCTSGEVQYSFDTLLKAIKALGITISENQKPVTASPTTDYSSLKDKSLGKLKKTYHGTLRQVLNQWCEDYGYSYSIDFSKSDSTSFTIKGIDLASGLSKEKVLQTKLEMEDLESATSNSSFVLKSEDLSYDLSQQQLKLYSSFYFKEAKEQSISYENDLGYKDFKNINLEEILPQIIGSSTRRDFSGSFRDLNAILTSAILGKYSPKLRQIYNYQNGYYQALGFIPLIGNSQILLPVDKDLIYSESISQALEVQSQVLFSSDGVPCYDIRLGFYNDELARAVLEMETFIADFIGRYYWTDEIPITDGEYGNEDFYAKYELTSSAPVQKVLVGQLYNLDVFKKARYLLNSIQNVFSSGTRRYYDAYQTLIDAANNIQSVCNEAQQAFINLQGNLQGFRKYRFFHERNSASYGVYQDYLNDITNLRISIAGNTTVAPEDIDLTEFHAPIFKEISPISLGLLQAAMPINIDNVALGSFKFGVLLSPNEKFQIYKFVPEFNKTNPIEVQNSIYSKCAKLLELNTSGIQSNLQRNKKTCSKTLLYQTCIQPCTDTQQNTTIQQSLDFAAGPDAYNCFRVKVFRDNTKINDNFVLGKLYTSSINSGTLSLQPTVENPGIIGVEVLRFPNIRRYIDLKTTTQYESIVAPSQATYAIRILTRSTSETFLPYKNYILGGLEDPNDLLKILNNESFSVAVNVNNLTPNVRELFGDATNPTFVSAPFEIQTPSAYPVFIEYQGYQKDKPTYEFLTLTQFHNALKSYYDSLNISSSQPNLKFDTEIFCSEIPIGLKSLLSVENGLVRLTISLAENGLNLACSFESYPKNEAKLENLILKNRPNIKLINTNYFK